MEGERLLIQCQIRVAKKKKRSVYTLGQTHSGEDNGYGRQIEAHVLWGREGDWIGFRGGVRREWSGLKLIYLLDGVYLYVSVDPVWNELILVQVNDGDSEACTLNAVNLKQ